MSIRILKSFRRQTILLLKKTGFIAFYFAPVFDCIACIKCGIHFTVSIGLSVYLEPSVETLCFPLRQILLMAMRVELGNCKNTSTGL